MKEFPLAGRHIVDVQIGGGLLLVLLNALQSLPAFEIAALLSTFILVLRV